MKRIIIKLPIYVEAATEQDNIVSEANKLRDLLIPMFIEFVKQTRMKDEVIERLQNEGLTFIAFRHEAPVNTNL